MARAYASAVVNAPPESVWATVIDVDANPANISSVESVDRIDGSKTGDAVTIGTRWRETRTFEGTAVAQTKTVSSVGYVGERGYDDDGGDESSSSLELRKDPLWPKSFSLAITYDAPYEGVCNTSTLTVQPYRGDDGHPGGANEGAARGDGGSGRGGNSGEESAKTTLLTGTCAAISSRLRHKIAFGLEQCVCSCLRKHDHNTMFQMEIDELGAAAERRAAAPAVETPDRTQLEMCASPPPPPPPPS